MVDFTRMEQTSMSNSLAFDASLKATQQTDAKNKTALLANQTEASAEKLQLEESENTPMGLSIKSSKLEKPEKAKTDKAERAQESVLLRKEDADGLADGFNQRQGNREYRLDPVKLSALAQLLGSEIKEDSQEADIINLIRSQLTVKGKEPEIAFIDKTLDFLIEVTRIQLNKSQGPLKERIEKILDRLDATKANYSALHQKDLLISHTIIPTVAFLSDQSGVELGDALSDYRKGIVNPQEDTYLYCRQLCKQQGYTGGMLKCSQVAKFAGNDTKSLSLESYEEKAFLGRLMQMIQASRSINWVVKTANGESTLMYRYLNQKGFISN